MTPHRGCPPRSTSLVIVHVYAGLFEGDAAILPVLRVFWEAWPLRRILYRRYTFRPAGMADVPPLIEYDPNA